MSKECVLLELAAQSFGEIADKLDAWAAESRKGGWSTHQVAGNLEWANKCRRNAAEIRRHLRGQP